MIGYKVNQIEMNSLIKEINKFGKVMNSPNLQLYRAKKFRDYTVKMLSEGGLYLHKITEATKKIQEKEHPPLYNDGHMARRMSIRPIKGVKGNAAEAGYFEKSKTIPGKDITYTQAAILAHTGFRINLKGKKGMRARRWLEWKLNIRFSPQKEYVTVQPRPFLYRSYSQYMLGGWDMKAVDRFFERMMSGLNVNV